MSDEKDQEQNVQESKQETPEDLASLRAALEDEQSKAQSYLAGWQRAQADFINYKRRADQERGEAQRLAIGAIIYQMLPILDDMERAFESADAKLSGLTWIDGLKLVHRKFQALLEAHGVKSINVVGQDFNPNLHEAVMYGEGQEGFAFVLF